MAFSPVEYRHEYVSGPLTVARTGFPVLISAQVVNRSDTLARARVRVWNGNALLPESEDGLVEPQDVWIYKALPVELAGIDSTSNSVWVQIRTTSPDLVPTLVFTETVRSSNGEVQGVRELAFFAPGDFAVFALHPVPVHPPPIGPLRET
jgi:hypothetical protein